MDKYDCKKAFVFVDVPELTYIAVDGHGNPNTSPEYAAAAEAPTLARLHDEFMPEHGLTFNGYRHEIYLSDALKTVPSELRTILRQPVCSVCSAKSTTPRLTVTDCPSLPHQLTENGHTDDHLFVL